MDTTNSSTRILMITRKFLKARIGGELMPQPIVIDLGCALDRVHNSCPPLDCLLALCDPVTLTYPIVIGSSTDVCRSIV